MSGEVEGMHTEHRDSWIGRTLLERYRIVRPIGQGGMGKVYLAEQKMGNAARHVAIKTLHTGTDPSLVARFHRESATVIQLSHPNTIQFYDFGELDDGTLLIVMEYVEGHSLAETLHQEGALPLPRVDAILGQICGSLQEAHDNGIIHRDLKPENILLTTRGGQDDFVKVLDFGIAKHSDEETHNSRLTAHDMVLGTPPYMSPEQFRGEHLDRRCDVYALGVLTYEMLTKQLPFEANTAWEWATQHLTSKPRPIDELYTGMPPLSEIRRDAIHKALAKDRGKRHTDALQFHQAFAQDSVPQPLPENASHVQPEATRASTTEQLSFLYQAPWWRRHPVLVAGAMIGLAMLAWFLQRDAQTTDSLDPTQATPPSDLDAHPPVDASMQIPDGRDHHAVEHKTQDTTPPPNAPSKTTRKARSRKKKSATQAKTKAVKPTKPKLVPVPPQREPAPTPALTQSVQTIQRLMQNNQTEQALQTLRITSATYGDAPSLRTVRTQLQRTVKTKVSFFLRQGRCPEAQNLYRTAQMANAHHSARSQFSNDWCPTP